MVNLKNKRIFITGGSGVIGKELTKILLTKDAKIFIGDIKECPKEFIKKVKYRRGDLNYITKEELIDFDPEIIIHLAATYERTVESKNFYNENYKNNLKLSTSILGHVRFLKNLKKYIFASSYLIYRDNLYLTKKNKSSISLNEKSDIDPRNLIGASKLYHEKEIEFFSKFFKKISFVSLRIFRGYGLGSRDVISRWVRNIIKKQNIDLYGENGSFDYIYSKDTAKGIINACGINKNFLVANLGSSKSIYIGEVIKKLKENFKKIKIKKKNNNILVENSKANISLFQQYTKWKPIYSLNKALKEIIKYEKKILKFNKGKYNAGNMLLSCFTSKKYPLYNFFLDALKNFDISSKIYLGNEKKSEFENYFKNYLIIPSLEKNNKQKVLKILKKFKIKLVIPTSDLELVFWSSNKNFFKKNKIEILVSNKSSIINCQDKYKFVKYCIDRKIPAVKILNFLKNKEKINYVIKERFAQHKKKPLIKVPFNKVNVLKLKFKNPIIQKYIKGKEISADIWMDNIKENNKIVLRERSEVIDGESKVTTIIHEQKIEKEILNYASKLNLKYHILIQAIIDSKKKIHIIECNPRFGGASTASINAGLPSIYNSIYKMLNSKQKHFNSLNRSFSKQFKFENTFYK